MLIWGWGSKSKRWQLNDDFQLIATWSYFELFFCPIGYDVEWFIAGDSRSQDRKLTSDDLKRMFPADTPNIGLWNKWGLALVLGGLLAYAVLVSIPFGFAA